MDDTEIGIIGATAPATQNNRTNIIDLNAFPLIFKFFVLINFLKTAITRIDNTHTRIIFDQLLV